MGVKGTLDTQCNIRRDREHGCHGDPRHTMQCGKGHGCHRSPDTPCPTGRHPGPGHHEVPTHIASQEAPWDVGVTGTPDRHCIAGGHLGCGCHGEPGHATHRGKAPMIWVSRGPQRRSALQVGTQDLGVTGTPETRCTAGGHPGHGCRGDPGDAVHRGKPHWGHGRRGQPGTPCITGRRAGTPGVGSVAGAGRGGGTGRPCPPGKGWGWGWLSPKQDVPLGAGDALRQPFAECPRLLHRPREEEEGRAPGSVAPRAAQGRRRRPAGREGAGDGVRGSRALRRWR